MHFLRELADVQAGFRKGRGTRDQIAHILWMIEKAKEFWKNIYFWFIDYAKAFVWITTNCGKFWKRWEYQTIWPASWEICMQVRKQQLELDMEKQSASKSGKEYIKAVYCHPAYLTYMQSTSWETLDWKKHKLESRPFKSMLRDCSAQYTEVLSESTLLDTDVGINHMLLRAPVFCLLLQFYYICLPPRP